MTSFADLVGAGIPCRTWVVRKVTSKKFRYFCVFKTGLGRSDSVFRGSMSDTLVEERIREMV